MVKIFHMNRIWEIDFLRGLAIILMIIYHLSFDLSEMYDYSINYERGIIYIIGKLSSTLFIILAGISSTLSRNNTKRSFRVLLFALLITVVTYFYDPEEFIGFGILHLLGFSMLISPFFINQKKVSLIILSIGIITLGMYFKNISAPNNYFFFLGLISPSYQALDYFPIFPYLGIFLLGTYLGKSFYAQKLSLFKNDYSLKIINYLGKHSFTIYLIHQPIILLLLFIIHRLN